MKDVPRWLRQGPAAYFPAIERQYGRPIDHWLELVATAPVSGRTELVELLRTDHGMDRGHANAVVAWYRDQAASAA
ncbi:MAG: DUF4287 domain-containing protein [Aeromicrobium erythreum]